MLMQEMFRTTYTRELTGSLLTGLAAYWKLDGSLGYVKDETGINNGTIFGATQNQSGKINSSFSFDGNDYIDCSSNASLQLQTFSISSWVNCSSVAGYKSIMAYSPTPGGVHLRVNTVSNLLAFVNNGNFTVATATSGIPPSQFSHIVATWNTSANYSFYVNGVNAGSGTSGFGPQTFLFGSFWIGRRPAAGDYFIGSIDELGVWNKVLTQTEVTKLYNSGLGLTYK